MNYNEKKVLYFFIFVLAVIFSIYKYWFSPPHYLENSVTKQANQIKKLQHDLTKAERNIYCFPQPTSQSPDTETENNRQNAISASRAALLQKKCKNAIVKIVVDQFTFNWQEPYKNAEQVEAFGSGFFIDKEGHFLTNFHVVSQATRAQFQMPIFGQEKLGCSVVGVCPDRDLALLKITESARKRILQKLNQIEYLKLGNSDTLCRGCEVLTLGFPLGKDVIKSTTGIVSGWEDMNLGERGGALSCLETTAPINGGSSGGPAINQDGEVIGINFAGVTKAQNIGYVLPINELKTAISQLHEQQLLFKPHLGLVYQTTTDSFDEHFETPKTGGIYIRRVLKGSLAEKSGIKPGDTICEVNGFVLDHHGDVEVPWREDKVFYTNILQRLEIGDEIEIVLYRSGQRMEIRFELESSDKSVKVRSKYPCHEDIDYEVFGGLVIMELAVNHISPEMFSNNTSLLEYAQPQNFDKSILVITFIQGTSEAHRNAGGLKKGSILKKVGDTPVQTLKELRQEINLNLNKKFITLAGDNLAISIFETAKLLEDEIRLSRMFRYGPENSISLCNSLAKTKGLFNS